MRAISVVFAGLLAMAVASSEKKVVCYFSSWAVYRPNNGKFDISHIDPSLCTHMIYAFVGITEDGDVKVLDAGQDLPDNYGKDGFSRFNKLREISPQTKTMIAIGGWNEESVRYSQVVGNPTIRKRFVENMVMFVKKYGFDGLDIDWEYPNQRGGVLADKDNYVALLRELREKFDQEDLILSAAVAAAEVSASQSYIISEMSKYLHFINLMTYDMHGIWEKKTGINAPLYAGSWEKTDAERCLNVNASVHYWLENGAPAEKLVLGVPFYGRGFTLANSQMNGIGAPANQPSMAGPYTRESGVLGYNEICEKFINENWHIEFQEEQYVPYAVSGNQWVGYDDHRSLTKKAEFAKNLGLGGMMVWGVETDDFKGVCGDKYPLLKTINYVLRDGQPPLPTNPPAETTAEPSANQPKPTEICKSEGYSRDPKQCNVFYYCQPDYNKYIVHEFSCPKPLVFDLRTNTCNYLKYVQC
ncbi:chitotriosidase-1-like isoform X2 [Phymastichus coffea]|nr:chitotriosidase-1-like isoform X2 [Phymastichus coffea]